MSGKASPINITIRQKEILLKLSKSRTHNHCHKERAEIILLSFCDKTNNAIAKSLGLNRVTVRLWRNRWFKNSESLSCIEKKETDNKKYRERIIDLLSDVPRRGAPCKFTPEQVCKLVALSCEPIADSGYPVSNWSLSLLAAEAKKRDIVPSISIRQLGRFLKSSRYKTS